MPRRRRDLNPLPPPSSTTAQPTAAPGSVPVVDSLEQQLAGVVQALRTNPDLLAVVRQLAQRPETVPTVNGALSLLAAAERAGDDAPFGKKFDALHGVVVDQGPVLLREISQAVAQRAVHKHEAKTPVKKGRKF